MKTKVDKVNSDKIQFILHRIISGVILWMVASYILTWQRYTISHFKNAFVSLLSYMTPFLIIWWFCSITGRKNQWKPFSKHSDIIGVSIIGIVYFILSFSIGNVKIGF